MTISRETKPLTEEQIQAIGIGQALRHSPPPPMTEDRMEGLYAYASGLASGWHGPNMTLAGEAMIDLWVEADRLRTLLEPEREPTWRDVFRAMHAAGYRLKIEERDDGYVKWIVPVGTMGEVASIICETSSWGHVSWTVELYGYLGYSVRLNNPPPSDVLDAAKLVKLLDTPPELLKAEAAILGGEERS